jgi:hypothetical protein
MEFQEIKSIVTFFEGKSKLYEEIRDLFGDTPNTILYKIIKNIRLFNVYKRSDSKKFINILEAFDHFVDGEILIFISELQLYGLFTSAEYLVFTKKLQEMFEEDSIDSTPHQVVLNNHRQKIVFMCMRPETDTIANAIVEKIKKYVREHFGANITIVENNEKTEITIEKIFDGDARNDNFEKFIGYISKRDRELANKISILRVVRDREYKYTTPILNRNISTLEELVITLKTATNVIINAPIMINAGIMGGDMIVQALENQPESSIRWVADNPPKNKEITTEYYQRYRSHVENPVATNTFGKCVREAGYKTAKGTNCRYWMK